MALINLNSMFPKRLDYINLPSGVARITIPTPSRFITVLESGKVPPRVFNVPYYLTANALHMLAQFFQKLNVPVFVKLVDDKELAYGVVNIEQEENEELYFNAEMNFAEVVNKEMILIEFEDYLEPPEVEDGKFTLSFVEGNEVGLMFTPSVLVGALLINAMESVRNYAAKAAKVVAANAAVGVSEEAKGLQNM